MTERQQIEIQAGVRQRCLDGQSVLYHQTTDEVTRLDETGTVVWSFLRDSPTLAALTAQLCDHFDQEPTIIGADIAEMIDELAQAQLVAVRDGATGGVPPTAPSESAPQ